MSRTPKTNHVYCPHCGSNNEPFFSRSVPMGFYCRDCGKDVDQPDQTMSDTYLRPIDEALQSLNSNEL